MCLLAPCVAAYALGVRVNTSPSLPMGLYLRTNAAAAALIEFCPAEPFGSLSSARGYRTPSVSCPDGAAPLLKPVVAREGDLVVVSADGISVNGYLLPKTAALTIDIAGRELLAWPSGLYRVMPGTVWVASTYNRGSFDSRYMGPINMQLIRAKLRPLWLLR